MIKRKKKNPKIIKQADQKHGMEIQRLKIKAGMQHNGTDNEGQNDVVKTTFIRTKSTSRPEVSISREDQDQVDRVKTGRT